MTNDDTRPLPDGTGAPVPPSPWASSQPVPPAAEHDSWVDVTPARASDGPVPPAPRPAASGRRVLGVVGLVAAGAVAGALIVTTVGGVGSATAAGQQVGAGQNVPGQNVPGGGGMAGGGPGGQGGLQGGVQGGVQGGPGQGTGREQRVVGTLTAVSGSTVTMSTSAGPATYQVVAQTQIVRGGALASASDLEVGDRVLAHVFPATGSNGVLERLIAVPGSGSAGSGPGTTDDGTTADDTSVDTGSTT